MHIKTPAELRKIAIDIQTKGGRVNLVGGSVRDSVRGCKPKDWDCEVLGLNYSTLLNTLSPHGKVNTVGRQFGVVKLTTESNDYDFTLSRLDNKTGRGHKGFMPVVDPELTEDESARRRDFTVNSMAYNVLTGEFFDPFGGLDDLKNGVLLHTSDAFLEDGAIRTLRGFKFAARMGLKAAPELSSLCSTEDCKTQLHLEHGNRILGEWLDWAVKGTHLGQGLQFLKDVGWLGQFTGLSELDETEQDSTFHPEGNVFEHTKLAVDSASKIAKRDKLNKVDTFVLVVAALIHDMGKIATTEKDSDGQITSHGHDTEQDAAEAFLDSIGIESHGAYLPEGIKDKILVLARHHMAHLNGFTPKSVRRLANKLAAGGATLAELARLMEVDHSARTPLPGGMPDGARAMLEIAAQDENVTDKGVTPILMGRHLIELGVKPGARMGTILRAAMDAQMEGGIANLEDAIEWAKRAI